LVVAMVNDIDKIAAVMTIHKKDDFFIIKTI